MRAVNDPVEGGPSNEASATLIPTPVIELSVASLGYNTWRIWCFQSGTEAHSWQFRLQPASRFTSVAFFGDFARVTGVQCVGNCGSHGGSRKPGCGICVVFAPTAAVPVSAVLNITSNAGNKADSLSATGAASRDHGLSRILSLAIGASVKAASRRNSASPILATRWCT